MVVMRSLRLLVLCLLVACLNAAVAFGAAGGGSGGFGGGGGSIGGLGTLIVFGGVAAVLVFSVVQQKRKATWSRGYAKARDALTASRREKRRADIALKALAAAEDDPAFAPDTVGTEAKGLFLSIQQAWDRDDRDALETMVAPDLMTEWRLRLADFASKGWRNHVSVKSCDVEYIGITNRAADEEDRVVVRVSAELEDYVIDGGGNRLNHDGNTGSESYLREYWTLGKSDGHWIVLSIEQDEEGTHQLDAPVEVDPSEDARMTDQARVEAAVANPLPAGMTHAEVDDEDAATALAKARDLSLVDERFDPDIIDATVRRGVAAWADAVDGDDAAFAHIARPDLLQELLYPPSPGRSLRLVVRAPVVLGTTLTNVDSDVTPPTATVHMQLQGIRYVEDRNTLDVVAGSQNRATRFDGTWTLALDGPDDAPWRIAAVHDDTPREGAPSS